MCNQETLWRLHAVGTQTWTKELPAQQECFLQREKGSMQECVTYAYAKPYSALLLLFKQLSMIICNDGTGQRAYLLFEFVRLLLGPGSLSLELPLLALLALGILLCTPE